MNLKSTLFIIFISINVLKWLITIPVLYLSHTSTMYCLSIKHNMDQRKISKTLTALPVIDVSFQTLRLAHYMELKNICAVTNVMFYLRFSFKGTFYIADQPLLSNSLL